MKLAVIHCRVSPWWALDVCKDLIKEEISWWFSSIQIFTAYSDLKSIKINNQKIKIITALPKLLNNFFQRNTKKKLPILGQIFDYRNLMLFYPLVMKILSRKIKKYQPNKILISSFAIAKNIQQCKTTSKDKIDTTLYLHSPMQYIRSHKEEYKQKLTWWKWRIFRQIMTHLQQRDLQYTKYNKVYTNSNYTKTIAKEIYNIEGEVKYPKINQNYFNEKIVIKPKDYFVYIGRIVKFVKEVDLIIKVFNKIWYSLIIIGSGPDEKELKKTAKENIEFTGRNPSNMLEIIKNAKWTINLTKESFWIGTAESLCLWVPVLGYSQWGTKELVDNNSWILIENKTEKEIINQFNNFILQKRDREYISSRARKIFIKRKQN